MSYIALYRKYRPNTFDSIIGQENVTKILKNQIKTGKISHAYIFSGTRGTGKTSAAKVFARAINCLNSHDGEPCNECEVCKNILEGNTTDVIEMDAASNNSVENIRQIRQEVVYNTIDTRYRVYIIDEAHMLTTSAFNALLKTLEEPPKNVVFILATTEQHKIPVTILSRCLRFEFNRISDEDIVKRLEYVLKEENIEYEKIAIEYIAKLAEGGLRDALSILDRCISESKEILKYDDVLRIVGAIDKNIISNLTQNIIENDSISAIKNIDEIIKKGKDLRQLSYQLTENFLDLLINDKENTNKYVKIIDRFSKLDNDLRLTSKPVIVLKSAIIEICNGMLSSNINNNNPQINVDNVNNSDKNLVPLINKISKLENEIEILKEKLNKLPNTRNNKITNININNNNGNSRNVSNILKKEDNSSDDLNLEAFEDEENFKKSLIEKGKLKIYSAMAGTKIYKSSEALVIMTENSFAYSILISSDTINILKDLYFELYGEEKNVIIKMSNEENNISKIEKTFKENNVNYTSID